MVKAYIPKYNGRDYWKNYLEVLSALELIDKWHQYARQDWFYSKGSRIHLELYDTGNSKAPTVVLAHGLAGYARLLLPFVIPLREKGYNVLVPDLHGYGYNDGIKGDFEWNTHVKNLGDTVKYAQKHFSGRIILGGISLGGPLAYAAAARFNKVDALVCWSLFDFSDKEFLYKETKTKRFTYLLMPVFKMLSLLIGNAVIKTYYLVSYETLSDSKDINK
ncbi:MAG: hypothetical protein CVU88_04150 [Firmicutes bacterium HGW-Firmicutes-13]|nr:MAG: hypothetical protein CVU88_04150 [Firmicutes bacterium HGW-Firmicutes-13]